MHLVGGLGEEVLHMYSTIYIHGLGRVGLFLCLHGCLARERGLELFCKNAGHLCTPTPPNH